MNNNDDAAAAAVASMGGSECIIKKLADSMACESANIIHNMICTHIHTHTHSYGTGLFEISISFSSSFFAQTEKGNVTFYSHILWYARVHYMTRLDRIWIVHINHPLYGSFHLMENEIDTHKPEKSRQLKQYAWIEVLTWQNIFHLWYAFMERNFSIHILRRWLHNYLNLSLEKISL